MGAQSMGARETMVPLSAGQKKGKCGDRVEKDNWQDIKKK